MSRLEYCDLFNTQSTTASSTLTFFPLPDSFQPAICLQALAMMPGSQFSYVPSVSALIPAASRTLSGNGGPLLISIVMSDQYLLLEKNIFVLPNRSCNFLTCKEVGLGRQMEGAIPKIHRPIRRSASTFSRVPLQFSHSWDDHELALSNISERRNSYILLYSPSKPPS